MMPATTDRPYRVELLLCGHHFRVSQWQLATIGAVASAVHAAETDRVKVAALL